MSGPLLLSEYADRIMWGDKAPHGIIEAEAFFDCACGERHTITPERGFVVCPCGRGYRLLAELQMAEAYQVIPRIIEQDRNKGTHEAAKLTGRNDHE